MSPKGHPRVREDSFAAERFMDAVRAMPEAGRSQSRVWSPGPGMACTRDAHATSCGHGAGYARAPGRSHPLWSGRSAADRPGLPRVRQGARPGPGLPRPPAVRPVASSNVAVCTVSPAGGRRGGPSQPAPRPHRQPYLAATSACHVTARPSTAGGLQRNGPPPLATLPPRPRVCRRPTGGAQLPPERPMWLRWGAVFSGDRTIYS